MSKLSLLALGIAIVITIELVNYERGAWSISQEIKNHFQSAFDPMTLPKLGFGSLQCLTRHPAHCTIAVTIPEEPTDWRSVGMQAYSILAASQSQCEPMALIPEHQIRQSEYTQQLQEAGWSVCMLSTGRPANLTPAQSVAAAVSSLWGVQGGSTVLLAPLYAMLNADVSALLRYSAHTDSSAWGVWWPQYNVVQAWPSRAVATQLWHSALAGAEPLASGSVHAWLTNQVRSHAVHATPSQALDTQSPLFTAVAPGWIGTCAGITDTACAELRARPWFPMLIQDQAGRTGNALFQWASGVGTTAARGACLAMDSTALEGIFQGPFPSPVQPWRALAVRLDDAYATYKPITWDGRPVLKGIGYWQSHRYFNAISRELLDPALKFHPSIVDAGLVYLRDQAGQLQPGQCIGLHVRLGDHVGGYLRLGTPAYFKAGVKLLRDKYGALPVLLASDDGKKALEYIGNISDVHVLETGAAETDLYLLSQCKEVVISRGTFGWWAAWLANHDNAVYYTEEFDMSSYTNIGHVTLIDYFPASWTGIDSAGQVVSA